MFLIVLAFLIVGGVLIFYQKLKALDKEYLYYIGLLVLIISFVLLPLFDPLQMLGYLAAALQERSLYSIFGAISGFLVINLSIYGFYLFLVSIDLTISERYKGQLITIKEYRKRRHPIFASYHIIGSAYYVVMGAPVSLIIFTIFMVFLNIEAKRVDEDSLRKFGEKFQAYKRQVHIKLYSTDIFCILIINYSLLIIGIIGLVFFPEL